MTSPKLLNLLLRKLVISHNDLGKLFLLYLFNPINLKINFGIFRISHVSLI
jgi:hypothetical protein